MQHRTDLALELATMTEKLPEGIKVEEDKSYEGLTVTRVRVLDSVGQNAIGKPPGVYITIEAPELTGTDAELAERVSQACAKELSSLIKDRLSKDKPVLIVGLGNRAVTPDSLGPRVVNHTMVTRHIFNLLPDQVDERMNCVSAIAPGVLGETGMESGEVISSLVKEVNPTCVIAIDSLAAMAAYRIATTVQIADTGISPGAGIGNRRPRLDEQSLGIPVIAVGVPMVVHAGEMIAEAAQRVMSDKGGQGQWDDKLNEVLKTSAGDLIVTPKEIDSIAESCAKTVANGLNMALHPGISLEETIRFLS